MVSKKKILHRNKNIYVNWEENTDNKKSTSGGAYFLGNFLISWFSKKQTSISLSISKT